MQTFVIVVAVKIDVLIPLESDAPQHQSSARGVC